MMDCDRVFGMKVRQPPEPETQWSAFLLRLTQMLMRPLQRGQSKSFRRNRLRFPQSVPLTSAVAMQRNQQRRRLRRGSDHVVIQIYLSGQETFEGFAVSKITH